MTVSIAIDAMGGDKGLEVTIPASINVLKRHADLRLVLVGDEDKIKDALIPYSDQYDEKFLEIHHAPQVVEMCELPSVALRTKKKSSMRIAINLVKSKEVQACVSAGNTGALMATSKFVLKTLPEIDRPAIVYAMPTFGLGDSKKVYMLDLGANVECSSEQLFQFGVMGSVLSSRLTKTEQPKVSLLNIGEEEMKGLDSIKQAAKKFKNCPFINYSGFSEGNDIFTGKFDVIVCDGFVGNIALKTSEGVLKSIGTLLKSHFNESNAFVKLGAAPFLKKLKSDLNPAKYNGASFLGLRGTVIKSHGGATSEAYETAIEEAILQVEQDIPNQIQAEVEVIFQQRLLNGEI